MSIHGPTAQLHALGWPELGGGPCHPCGSPYIPSPNPAPNSCALQPDPSGIRQPRCPYSSADPAPLPTHPKLLPQSALPQPRLSRSSVHPPTKNAPLPRGQGRGHPTSLTRPSRRHQMTFTAGQVPCGPHYTSAGSRAPPHPRRTAPTSSPRSAASPPASAASAGGGPGGGRGGASRTARWPPGLVVPLVEPRGAMRPRLDSTSQEATQGAGSRLARPTRPRASWP